ncbi:hypothetical protein V5F49_11210 [Xanthobacter sp. V3C-3]|uniref:hypothetical protein n=1 Tax=Xanthobacter lutulentifluminis TaxID=3119935 RepID=UPI003726649E
MTDEQTEEISGASQLPPAAAPETAGADAGAAPTEAAPPAEPPAAEQPAPAEHWPRPLPWEDLVPFSTTSICSVALDLAGVIEPAFLERFADGPLDPATYGLFNFAHADSDEVVRYIVQHRPSAETLCIRTAELQGDRTPTAEDLAAILPSFWAQLELAVRLIPAVVDALEAVNAELARRRPPVIEPPPAVPVPIGDTILEEMPGFGELMER